MFPNIIWYIANTLSSDYHSDSAYCDLRVLCPGHGIYDRLFISIFFSFSRRPFFRGVRAELQKLREASQKSRVRPLYDISWSCRRRHLWGGQVETHSIPWQLCLLSKSLVLLTFLKLRSRREAAFNTPRVVMTSEWEGSRPSHLMIIPNTKGHPNNMKTDELPVMR